jgi:sulfatase maturation enzyme AslB (radical SAM superfamily)
MADRESKVRAKYCPVPWVSQAIRNNGDLRICCHSKVSASEGTLKKPNGESFRVDRGELDESRNSSLSKQLRASMLRGESHPVCKRCDDEDVAGIRSRRTYENEFWGKHFSMQKAREVTAEDGGIDTENPPVLHQDIRFGNLCNLKCRMCGPTDSNSWYSDHAKLFGMSFKDSHGVVQLVESSTGKVVTKNGDYDWIHSEKFWSSLKEVSRGSRHVYIVGGEPLLIDEHWQFLDYLVRENLSEKMTLEYNTNLTVLPKNANEIWQSFKEVRLGVSIDGFGAINDYIRFPSKFDKIVENIRKIDREKVNASVWFALTVQALNIGHLTEFMDWILSSEDRHLFTTPGCQFFKPHQLHGPHFYNPRVLPQEYKQKLKNRFDDYLAHLEGHERYTERLGKEARKILDAYSTYMLSEDWSEHLSEFQRVTHSLDGLRKQSFRETLPDLEKAVSTHLRA